MCTRPINLQLPDPWGCNVMQTVPCGKCPECLKDRQNSWKLRLCEEARNWSHLYFFTLTYRDSSLPVTEGGLSTASVSDIQDWIKRFRINLERSTARELGLSLGSLRSLNKFTKQISFKYFICAEYAPAGTYVDRHGKLRESTCRPHYHGLIFSNMEYEKLAPLFAEWKSEKGFVNIAEVGTSRSDRSSVANYAAKYCCKGEFASRRDEISQGLISRAFTLMSKGIGASYPDRMRSYHLLGRSKPVGLTFCVPLDRLPELYARYRVSDGDFLYKMPRYWRDRIYRMQEMKPVIKWKRNDDNSFVPVETSLPRFTGKGALSRQLSRYIQNLVLEKRRSIDEKFGFATYQDLGFSPYGDTLEDIEFRESRVRDKLSVFYRTNAQKNSELVFESV